jgi:hypothetical protein
LSADELGPYWATTCILAERIASWKRRLGEVGLQLLERLDVVRLVCRRVAGDLGNGREGRTILLEGLGPNTRGGRHSLRAPFKRSRGNDKLLQPSVAPLHYPHPLERARVTMKRSCVAAKRTRTATKPSPTVMVHAHVTIKRACVMTERSPVLLLCARVVTKRACGGTERARVERHHRASEATGVLR